MPKRFTATCWRVCSTRRQRRAACTCGDIKGKAGELGLKVGGAENYFGLVYIGDTASFKDLIEAECPEVEVEEDQIAEGLFENIKKPESRINVLIGAKKFMQGWDSWRVTNMGLLNIGRSEGIGNHPAFRARRAVEGAEPQLEAQFRAAAATSRRD